MNKLEKQKLLDDFNFIETTYEDLDYFLYSKQVGLLSHNATPKSPDDLRDSLDKSQDAIKRIKDLIFKNL